MHSAPGPHPVSADATARRVSFGGNTDSAGGGGDGAGSSFTTSYSLAPGLVDVAGQTGTGLSSFGGGGGFAASNRGGSSNLQNLCGLWSNDSLGC